MASPRDEKPTFCLSRYQLALCRVPLDFHPDRPKFLALTFHMLPKSLKDPSAVVLYDRAIDRYHSALFLRPVRDCRAQPTITGKNMRMDAFIIALTLLPFSTRARSHTATSPANLLNSLTCTSNSDDHLLTISSIVLPLSADGGAITIEVDVLPAGGAGAVVEPEAFIRDDVGEMMEQSCSPPCLSGSFEVLGAPNENIGAIQIMNENS